MSSTRIHPREADERRGPGIHFLIPDEVGAGLRVGRRVGLLDIVPTVLSELSLPIPEAAAGLPLQDDFSESEGSAVLVRLPERRKPERTPFRLSVSRSVAGEPIAPETDPRTRGAVTRDGHAAGGKQAVEWHRISPASVGFSGRSRALAVHRQNVRVNP